MKALGMIEVYGYLAAVEALDSALKAANVKLVDVVCVSGGIVSVLITGDVGATRAAIDASAAAAARVGHIVSVHVIPRPAADIERMLGNGPRGGNPAPKAPEPEKPSPDDSASDDLAPDDLAPDDLAPDDLAPDDSASDDLAPDDLAPDDSASDDLAPDDLAPDDSASDDLALDDLAPDDLVLDDLACADTADDEPEEGLHKPIDLNTLTPDTLRDMTVVELRHLVRLIGKAGMTRKQIRYAKKEELTAEILKFCGQEG